MTISSLILAAVVAAQPSSQQPANEPKCQMAQGGTQYDVGNANKGSLLHLRVADRDAKEKNTPKPAAEYVRLKVEFLACSRDDERDYNAETRWWGKRMFLHKTVGKVLKVTATVKPLGVSGSKTLSSIGFDSGDKGETWTTDVENDSILMPYFRAHPHAVVNLDITFSSTREYQASVAGTTLDIVKRAATLISPTSSLITKENIGGFNDAASFVDTTVAGLLKLAINENVHLGIPLDGNEALATLTLFVPIANDPHLSPLQDKRPVGQWRIIAESFSGSIFQLAKNGASDEAVSAAAIMNFKVSDDKSLKAALTASNNVQVARDALLKLEGNDTEISDAALTLCRATAVEADAQGFSYDDTGRIVWAYIKDLALPTSKRGLTESACGGMEFAWAPPPKTGSTESAGGGR